MSKNVARLRSNITRDWNDDDTQCSVLEIWNRMERRIRVRSRGTKSVREEWGDGEKPIHRTLDKVSRNEKNGNSRGERKQVGKAA